MNSSQRRAAARNQPSPTSDGFQNLVLKLGGANDPLSMGSGWMTNGLTQNKQQLDSMYESSWIVGNAVDAPAEDMTRAGIDLLGIDPNKGTELQGAITAMALWRDLTSTIKWARLYGGAAAFMMVDGQNPQTPLDPETVSQDQFSGLKVFDRWMINPQLTNGYRIMEGREIGMPEFYTVPRLNLTIHHSRLLIFRGIELPHDRAEANSYWGNSIVERLLDRLIAFDSATQGTAKLVHRAYLRTVQIEDLREILAMGGTAESNLVKMFALMSQLQANEGITLLDSKDTFTTTAYSFAGLDDVLVQFAQQLAGATGIPLVRLLGQSPAGLNSTGEGDMRTYHENIAQKQEAELRLQLRRLLEVTHASALGSMPDDEFDFEFKSLKQMDIKEKAETGEKMAKTIGEAYAEDLIDRPTAMRELKNISTITGLFTNITDDLIEEADKMVAEAKLAPPGESELDPLTGLPKPPPPQLPGNPANDPNADPAVKSNGPPKQAPSAAQR